MSTLSLLLAAFAPAHGAPAGEAGQGGREIGGYTFQEEVDFGPQVMAPRVQDFAFGTFNGKQVAYTATASDGSLVNMIDVETNTVIQTALMDSVNAVWKIELAPNGKVYIAAIGNEPVTNDLRGEFWIYDPATNEAEFIDVIEGSQSTWSLAVDENSNAYIGTYGVQEGKHRAGEVVKYDAATGEFTHFGRIDNNDYVRSIEYHDGYVYAGTGSVGSVVKIDVNDPTKRKNISDAALAMFGDEFKAVLGDKPVPFAYDMQKVGKWLLVNFSGPVSSTLFYNLETGEWSSEALIPSRYPGTPTQNGVPGFTQLTPKGDTAYLTFNGNVAKIELGGDAPEISMTGVPFGMNMRGQAWADLSELGL
ncbi:hypothetical protein, partial [Timonella senegalensis]